MKERIRKALRLLLSLARKESSRVAKSGEAKELMKEFKAGAKEGEAKLKHGVLKLKHKASRAKSALKRKVKARAKRRR